ncbi:MAG: alpha/beta hydrolase [Chloroflexi bacterium]|nr:alpha/beta hydrolase [Chloroflexota bacterium]
MTAWSSGVVIANGLRIHFHRTGGDHPPLVLSHGATDAGLCWTRLARALEADYDVIMPDARGHGRSEEPRDGYTSEARATDLAEFIRALRLDRPVVGGHSMGALTTLTLLADYPGLARAAILEDGVFRLPDGTGSQADREGFAAWIGALLAERSAVGRDDLLARGRSQHPDWAEEDLGPWVDALLTFSPSVAAVRPAERRDWREIFPEVTEPMLVITADPERGGIITPEVAARMASLQPLTTVVRIRQAGHDVRREQFDAYLQAVRAFLTEVVG